MVNIRDRFTLCQVVSWSKSVSGVAWTVRAVLMVKRLHASNGARADTDRNSDPAHASANIDDRLVSSNPYLHPVSYP